MPSKNNFNPYKFSLFSSLYITIGAYFVINYSDLTISLRSALVSFFIFGLSFLIIQLRLKKLFFERVKQIYKDLEFETDSLIQTSVIDSDINSLTKDLGEFVKLKKSEIETLKREDVYRKEFVGNVAHELKTPLFTVQGYISTLLDGAMDNQEILKKYLQRADKGVERLIYIVQDLDLITKIEFGENKLSKSNFDIIVLIKNIFEDLEMKAKKKNISLLLDDSVKNSIMVYADMERIQQVVTNLIVNSIKYGDTNGTTEVSVEPFDAKKFVVRITDNGEGIDEEHIPRLFERFYRVDKSGSRTEGGSGLGLSIVKHIIDAHKESIFVESKYGIGSEFSFTLPQAI